MKNEDEILEALGKIENESTRKSYVTRIRTALKYTKAKDTKDMVTNVDKYYPILARHYPTMNSLKSLLTTMMAVYRYEPRLKETHEEEYQKLLEYHKDLSEKIDAEEKQSLPTERQMANYVSFNEVRSKLKEMLRGGDIHAKLQESMQTCLLGMMVYLRPKRADYGSLRVYRGEDPNVSDENYVVIHKDSDPSYIVLNHYKTSEKYKRMEEEFDERLNSIIRASLRRHPRSYVFQDRGGSPYTNASYGKYFTRTCKALFGREMGVSLWRHVYITERIDPKKKSLQEQEEDARLMLHSKTLQDRYRFKVQSSNSSSSDEKKRKTYECHFIKKN